MTDFRTEHYPKLNANSRFSGLKMLNKVLKMSYTHILKSYRSLSKSKLDAIENFLEVKKKKKIIKWSMYIKVFSHLNHSMVDNFFLTNQILIKTVYVCCHTNKRFIILQVFFLPDDFMIKDILD